MALPVDARTRMAFLALVVAQAVHSIEEMAGGLYAVFAPARWISGLVSADRATGFALVNAAIVAFGIWCWVVPVRRNWPLASGLAWGWVVVEAGNGTGHAAMALARGGYFPGVITAPLLILGAGWLAVNLRRGRR